MASFNKADYFRVFQLASQIHQASRHQGVKEDACQIMDLVESCLGQQYRPAAARPFREPREEARGKVDPVGLHPRLIIKDTPSQ